MHSLLSRLSRRGMAWCAAVFLASLATLPWAACQSQTEDQSAGAGPRPPRQAALVSEHPLATNVGLAILDRGGNAADAAVATALALSVVHPQAGNLGGGGFALWVGRKDQPVMIDFRETAPLGADPKWYLDEAGAVLAGRAHTGALSIGVPGTPAGLWHLWRNHGSGRLSWRELVLPAIALARDGFVVNADLEADLQDEQVRQRLAASPLAASLFLRQGKGLAAGEMLVQSELAQTLERLAKEGPSGFYRGPVAQAMVRELDQVCAAERIERSACLGLEDLDKYQVKVRPPLIGWFRGHEIISAPPPSSGGVILLQVLGILDGFPLGAQRQAALSARERAGTSAVESDEAGIDARLAHWWIEALRSAFQTRASSLGDPDFVAVDLAQLLSTTWIASRRVQIGEGAGSTSAVPSEAAPRLRPEGMNTTHLSVLDSDGNAVALTTTLNSSFGSGIAVRGAGFLLNNELDDFALPQATPNQFGLIGGEKNRLAPGKRPLSSMAPTVVRAEDKSVRMVLGSPGGPRIPTSVLGVLLRTLVFEQSLKDAVAAPRLHQQTWPGETDFEAGWPAGLLDALKRRGHKLRSLQRTWGSVQAIRVAPDGTVEVASDPRSRGSGGVQERRAR